MIKMFPEGKLCDLQCFGCSGFKHEGCLVFGGEKNFLSWWAYCMSGVYIADIKVIPIGIWGKVRVATVADNKIFPQYYGEPCH